jgi:WD40 repeat protein
LASGSYDKTVKLWDVATGKERATLKGHEGAVYAVAFAPDGDTLASGSFDTTVRLWETKTGKGYATLRGHAGYVWSLAFAPNGKCLAAGSGVWHENPGKPGDGHGDGDVKVWDMATRKATFSETTSVGPVLCVAFAADSKTLAVCGPDATVRLWDSTTGKQPGTLKGHTGKVCCVAFANSGKRLASGSQDTTIRLWDIPSLKKADR